MIYLVIILAIVGWVAYFKQRKTQVVIKQKNDEIDRQCIEKQKKLLEINTSIQDQNEVLQTIRATAESLKKDAQVNADKEYQRVLEAMKREYDDKEEELINNFNEKEKALKNDYTKQKAEYDKNIKEVSELLNDLKSKYSARMEAKLREEEIKSKESYYKLNISDQDKEDIKCLRQLQGRLGRRDSIDKLIWDVYYKPAYDALMPRLSPSASKICGIYKITNVTTGMAYIGQSVDIKERFRQHIKAAISSSPATNKLYQAMKEYGLYDFTFEILEKDIPRTKLNERETYWIDFYDTKKFGLNKTVGGS